MLVNNPRRITHKELYILASKAKGSVNAIYLHWTAGRYGQYFDDYHINIDKGGEVYLTCNSLTDLKHHTYNRNSKAIGVTLCCAFAAVCGYDGRPTYVVDPPTTEQINQMAVVIAVLTAALGLEVSFSTVKTHYEVALLDGYGPCGDDPDVRWDLSWLSAMPRSKALRPGGALLREKALDYLSYFEKRNTVSAEERQELVSLVA